MLETKTLQDIGDALGIAEDADNRKITISAPVSSEQRPNNEDDDGEGIRVPTGETDERADFEFARENLVQVISTGEKLLKRVTMVASESESARMFEVAASMLGTQIVAAKSLLSLHEQHRKIMSGDVGSKADTTVNNNTFVGTATELQRLLRKS